MLKLNVYSETDRSKVEKTYEAETVDIFWGTIEDITEKIDVNVLDFQKGKETMIEVGKTVVKLIPSIKPVLKDVFIGLTDEELRNCKASDMGKVFIEIVRYAYEQMTTIDDNDSGN